MPKKDMDTRQLIAEGEALRGKKKGARSPRTRQLVRDAERLIGREPERPSRRLLYVLIGVGLLALVGFTLWSTLG